MDRITNFIRLGKKLNSLVDEKESLEITTLYPWMENREVFDGLERYFGDELGLFEFTYTDRKDLEDFFWWISSDSEPEDMDIDSNGLCLLITYCLVGIEMNLTDSY